MLWDGWNRYERDLSKFCPIIRSITTDFHEYVAPVNGHCWPRKAFDLWVRRNLRRSSLFCFEYVLPNLRDMF